MATKKPQPVLIAQSCLAGLAFIFGGLTTIGAANGNQTMTAIGGIGTLITGGVNIAVGFYVKGQVVPLSDVASYLNSDRVKVDGPAK